jgi:hypothetical protein
MGMKTVREEGRLPRWDHGAVAELSNDGHRHLGLLTIDGAELLSHILCQFRVLFAIFSNGHEISLIQQNISCHQRWVIEETDANLLFLLVRFFLELCQALHPAQQDAANQDPSQFSMGPDVGANEDE